MINDDDIEALTCTLNDLTTGDSLDVSVVLSSIQCVISVFSRGDSTASTMAMDALRTILNKGDELLLLQCQHQRKEQLVPTLSELLCTIIYSLKSSNGRSVEERIASAQCLQVLLPLVSNYEVRHIVFNVVEELLLCLSDSRSPVVTNCCYNDKEVALISLKVEAMRAMVCVAENFTDLLIPFFDTFAAITFNLLNGPTPLYSSDLTPPTTNISDAATATTDLTDDDNYFISNTLAISMLGFCPTESPEAAEILIRDAVARKDICLAKCITVGALTRWPGALKLDKEVTDVVGDLCIDERVSLISIKQSEIHDYRGDSEQCDLDASLVVEACIMWETLLRMELDLMLMSSQGILGCQTKKNRMSDDNDDNDDDDDGENYGEPNCDTQGCAFRCLHPLLPFLYRALARGSNDSYIDTDDDNEPLSKHMIINKATAADVRQRAAKCLRLAAQLLGSDVVPSVASFFSLHIRQDQPGWREAALHALGCILPSLPDNTMDDSLISASTGSADININENVEPTITVACTNDSHGLLSLSRWASIAITSLSSDPSDHVRDRAAWLLTIIFEYHPTAVSSNGLRLLSLITTMLDAEHLDPVRARRLCWLVAQVVPFIGPVAVDRIEALACKLLSISRWRRGTHNVADINNCVKAAAGCAFEALSSLFSLYGPIPAEMHSHWLGYLGTCVRDERTSAKLRAAMGGSLVEVMRALPIDIFRLHLEEIVRLLTFALDSFTDGCCGNFPGAGDNFAYALTYVAATLGGTPSFDDNCVVSLISRIMREICVDHGNEGDESCENSVTISSTLLTKKHSSNCPIISSDSALVMLRTIASSSAGVLLCSFINDLKCGLNLHTHAHRCFVAVRHHFQRFMHVHQSVDLEDFNTSSKLVRNVPDDVRAVAVVARHAAREHEIEMERRKALLDIVTAFGEIMLTCGRDLLPLLPILIRRLLYVFNEIILELSPECEGKGKVVRADVLFVWSALQRILECFSRIILGVGVVSFAPFADDVTTCVLAIVTSVSGGLRPVSAVPPMLLDPILVLCGDLCAIANDTDSRFASTIWFFMPLVVEALCISTDPIILTSACYAVKEAASLFPPGLLADFAAKCVQPLQLCLLHTSGGALRNQAVLCFASLATMDLVGVLLNQEHLDLFRAWLEALPLSTSCVPLRPLHHMDHDKDDVNTDENSFEDITILDCLISCFRYLRNNEQKTSSSFNNLVISKLALLTGREMLTRQSSPTSPIESPHSIVVRLCITASKEFRLLLGSDEFERSRIFLNEQNELLPSHSLLIA